MADVRGKHVDSHVLYVRCVCFTLDRVFFGRLENDLYRHVSSLGVSDSDALAGTRKCSMACESRSSGEGYQYLK